VRHLDDALRLEQDLLAQVRDLIGQLPEESAYRLLLERHEEKLEEAIERIEQLGRPRGDDEQQPG
jgi:hypothetical protein